MNIEQICREYVDAEHAARRLKAQILEQALSNGDTHLFSLNMRAVHAMARDQKKPRRS